MDGATISSRSGAPSPRLFLFVLAVWAVATLYFGGDLGRMADDYAMLRRDPVSGALHLPATFTAERPFFIRPVYFLTYTNLITLAYGNEWCVHVLMALVHGLAGFLLYAVLRRANVGVLAASAAGLLFLVVPQCHESVFWMAALGYDAALSAFLVLALVALRRPSHGLLSLWLPFVLAFHVACWNEAAAAAIPALPFLFLAARPADQPLGRGARLALKVTGACLAAVGLYLLLYFATVPAGERGSPQTLISPGELWPRLVQVARDVRRTSLGSGGRELVLGGLLQASQELRSARGVITLGLLGITGAFFAASWAAARPLAASSAPGRAPPRLGWLALFGAGVVLLAFVPNVVLRTQPLGSRLWTLPSGGFALLAGCGLEALLRAAARRGRRWPAGVLGAAVAACAVTLAACMVGLQALYRENSRLDRSVPEQLAARIPEPPPGTLFVLLEARAQAGHTGQPRFDRGLPSAWHHHYGIGPLTREVFARDDIDVTPLNPMRGLELADLDPATFTAPSRIVVDGALRTPKGWCVPWKQTVPFVIGASGEVTLVRRVWIEDPAGRDLEVAETRVPRSAPAMPSFVLPARYSGRTRLLSGWRLGGRAGTGAAVPLRSGRAFGLERPVLELGSTGPAGLTAPLEACPTPSVLVFRIALAGETPPEGTARLTCGWESGPEPPLAQLELAFAELSGQGRWTPFLVALPPLATERPIRLQVTCDGAGGSQALLLTPGERAFPELQPRRP